MQICNWSRYLYYFIQQTQSNIMLSPGLIQDRCGTPRYWMRVQWGSLKKAQIHDTTGSYEQTKQSMALAVAKTQVWEFKELCSLWVRNLLSHVKAFKYHWVLFMSKGKMVIDMKSAVMLMLYRRVVVEKEQCRSKAGGYGPNLSCGPVLATEGKRLWIQAAELQGFIHSMNFWNNQNELTQTQFRNKKQWLKLVFNIIFGMLNNIGWYGVIDWATLVLYLIQCNNKVTHCL